MDKWSLLLIFIVGITIYEITGKIALKQENQKRINQYHYNSIVWISATGVLISFISLAKIYYLVTGEKPFLVKAFQRKIILFIDYLRFLKEEIRRFSH